MFPFNTKQFSFQTDLTVERLQDRLSARVSKRKFIALDKDGQLYGKINHNNATIELGQSFRRNSFQPVVVFKWTKADAKTEISGYYRVSLSVLLGTLLIPLFGLYMTIKINNILPVLLLTGMWAIIYLTFGRWLFIRDFKWIETEFTNLVKE